MLQPILASRAVDGSYEVIDGARRLEALRELGIRDLILGREIVIDTDEREADLQFKQVIANVQREDLNPVELGQAFVALKEEYGYQYNEIAEIIGKTPHYVAAKVGLIKRLDPQVQNFYVDDLFAERCSQSTSDGEPRPYLMNMNVVEDIARVPPEHQLEAYETIREGRMDKASAIGYLRTLKENLQQDAQAREPRDDAGRLADNRPEKTPHRDLETACREQIRRIERDVEQLASSVKSCGGAGQDIAAEIDELINRLCQLSASIKSPGRADNIKALGQTKA